MIAQNFVEIKSDSDEISSDDGEDKKFVSQAVAFVIGHARNGFVALCASVASLLKEQARLKQEVESLQQEISLLKHKTEKTCKFATSSVKREYNILLKSQNPCKSIHNSNYEKCVQNLPESSLAIKHLKKPPYRKLRGCICSQCIQNKTLIPLAVPLKRGMKVVIRGDICGVAHYIGHIESLEFPEIYVGIKLNEPVGNSDGCIGDKVHFSVPKNYGIFVPLSHIRCILRDNIKS